MMRASILQSDTVNHTAVVVMDRAGHINTHCRVHRIERTKEDVLAVIECDNDSACQC